MGVCGGSQGFRGLWRGERRRMKERGEQTPKASYVAQASREYLYLYTLQLHIPKSKCTSDVKGRTLASSYRRAHAHRTETYPY